MLLNKPIQGNTYSEQSQTETDLHRLFYFARLKPEPPQRSIHKF